MQLYPTLYWTRDHRIDYSKSLQLAQICPAPGESRTVHLGVSDSPSTGSKIHLIWQPPFSEMNSWLDQPSEIALSLVVTGVVKFLRHIPYEESTIGSTASNFYSIEVENVRSFVDMCKSNSVYSQESPFPTVLDCTKTELSSYMHWEKVGWCQKAEIADLIYLTGDHYETSLEALFLREGGVLVLVFHSAIYNYLCSDCTLVRYRLSRVEQELFENLILNAESFTDSVENYLE